MKKNIILGINFPVLADGSITYDGNIVLATEDEIIVAVAEERISKIKYDGNVQCAIEDVLKRNKMTFNDLSAVSIVGFGQPMTDDNIVCAKFLSKINKIIPNDIKIHFIKSHHEAHALTAITQSSVKRALVVVADHTGNIIGKRTDNEVLENNAAEQTSYFLYENNNLTLVARDHYHPRDLGYGRFYGDVTCYLGFNSYRESGKTMGLASFGNPDTFSQYSPFICDPDSGEMVSALRNVAYTDDCTKDLKAWFQSQGVELLDKREPDGVIRPFDMDLAAWAQDQLEKSINTRVKGLIEKYNVDTVCLTGGVAMNSVMNWKMEKELGIDVYIPPSPGDAGLAIGAVADYFWKENQNIPKFKTSPYLGPIYTSKEIREAVYSHSNEFDITETEDSALYAAKAIADHKVIGWYQDQSEYGPRALGNRSILTLPENNWMKEILNNQIKLREWFRPYAPVVLEEKADMYFDMLSPVPYMMKVAEIKIQAKVDMPACIHVDGTARLQTVNKDSNPKFYKLIKELDNITGVPIVLNTSFNLAGMAIVETPDDAINCFKKAIGMDLLIVDKYILSKK